MELTVSYENKAVTRLVWKSDDEVTGTLFARILNNPEERVYEGIPLSRVLFVIDQDDTDWAFTHKINDVFSHYTIDTRSYSGSFD